MTKIINAYDGARLYELDTFHSMLADDYLSNKDNPQTKFISEQFFKMKEGGITDERLKLLNLSYGLPSLIVEKFADYAGEPINPLEIDLDPFISSFIWGGIAVFRPKVHEGRFSVDYVSPSEYLLNDDGSERILMYFEVANSNDQVTTYLLDEYYVKNTVSRTLYKVLNRQSKTTYSINGDIVPLNSLPQTENLLPYEEFPGITESPLIVVNNRILTGRKYGTSELKKVRSLISSIEIEAVNIQDQFLKHLQAKMAVPNSAMKVDENGVANVRNLEVFGMEAGDTVPTFVVNSNPLIDKSFEQIESFLRQICAIITIPTEFMGLKDGGTAESADTKKIRLASFIKKIEKIRDKFTKAFREIDKLAKVWLPASELEGDFKITWPAIFPDEPQVLATELQIAQDARLISNIRAIMRFQNLSLEEAQKEQEIINKEKSTVDTGALMN